MLGETVVVTLGLAKIVSHQYHFFSLIIEYIELKEYKKFLEKAILIKLCTCT